MSYPWEKISVIQVIFFIYHVKIMFDPHPPLNPPIALISSSSLALTIGSSLGALYFAIILNYVLCNDKVLIKELEFHSKEQITVLFQFLFLFSLLYVPFPLSLYRKLINLLIVGLN